MRLRLVVPAVLGLGTAALAAEPTALQALSATSGEGVEKVLDGDPATGWRPQGDAEEEGVLLRFEQPLALDAVTLRACTGSPDLSVALSQNGCFICPLCQGRYTRRGELRQLEADHIFPFSRGGETSWQNFQLLCKACNRHKSDSVQPSSIT